MEHVLDTKYVSVRAMYVYNKTKHRNSHQTIEEDTDENESA